MTNAATTANVDVIIGVKNDSKVLNCHIRRAEKCFGEHKFVEKQVFRVAGYGNSPFDMSISVAICEPRLTKEYLLGHAIGIKSDIFGKICAEFSDATATPVHIVGPLAFFTIICNTKD